MCIEKMKIPSPKNRKTELTHFHCALPFKIENIVRKRIFGKNGFVNNH